MVFFLPLELLVTECSSGKQRNKRGRAGHECACRPCAGGFGAC